MRLTSGRVIQWVRPARVVCVRWLDGYQIILSHARRLISVMHWCIMCCPHMHIGCAHAADVSSYPCLAWLWTCTYSLVISIYRFSSTKILQKQESSCIFHPHAAFLWLTCNKLSHAIRNWTFCIPYLTMESIFSLGKHLLHISIRWEIFSHGTNGQSHDFNLLFVLPRMCLLTHWSSVTI